MPIQKRKKLPKTFTIDRSKWQRGKGRAEMLDAHGKMCCLGFFGKACGYTDEELFKYRTPESVAWRDKSLFPAWMLKTVKGGYPDQHEHTPVAEDLMRVNDQVGLPATEREAIIKRTFAKHGVEVRFVDGEKRRRGRSKRATG
jgi:hypothetical protein